MSLPSSASESSRSRPFTIPGWFPPLAVSVLTLAVFYSSLKNGWVNWDDDVNFLNNPAYRGLGFRQISWMFRTVHLGVYIPLTWMTLGADFLLWGLRPAGYHLSSLIFQIANAALVYFIALRLLDQDDNSSADPASLSVAAAFGALFFSIHPLRVESVAWITERRDVVSGFFFLASLLFYLQNRKAMSVAGFALSLLSKAGGIMMPALLILVDIYRARQTRSAVDWRKSLLGKTPYALIALPFAFLAVQGQKAYQAMAPSQLFTPLIRLGVAAHGTLFYFAKTFWPIGLSPYYELPFPLTEETLRLFPNLTILALLTASGICLYRRGKNLLLAWLWYLVALLPVSGIFQSGTQFAADRYSYLPVLGFSIVLGSVLLRLERRHRWPARGAALLVLAGLAVLTWRQIFVWRGGETLWRRAIQIDGGGGQAHYGLAGAYLAKGETDAAISELKLATRSPYVSLDARNNLGAALASQGRFAEAVAEFKFVLSRNPSDVNARRNLERATILLNRR